MSVITTFEFKTISGNIDPNPQRDTKKSNSKFSKFYYDNVVKEKSSEDVLITMVIQVYDAYNARRKSQGRSPLINIKSRVIQIVGWFRAQQENTRTVKPKSSVINPYLIFS